MLVFAFNIDLVSLFSLLFPAIDLVLWHVYLHLKQKHMPRRGVGILIHRRLSLTRIVCDL